MFTYDFQNRVVKDGVFNKFFVDVASFSYTWIETRELESIVRA